MSNSNLLFESIFQRKLSDAGTQEFLTQITTDYPYFSPAQFFLLLQTEKGTPAYELQAAKTSVLFNNPWWLQFQLQEKLDCTDEVADIINPKAAFTAPPVDQYIQEIPEQNAILVKEGAKTQPAETTIISDAEPAINQEELKGSPAEIESTVFIENATEPVADNIFTFSGGETGEVIADEPGELTITEQPALAEKEQSIVKEEKTDIVESEVPVLSGAENNEGLMDVSSNVHFNNNDTPLVNETETDTEENTNDEREIEPLNFKLNLENSTTTEDTIVFEPLHTSDYFASLGIKLSGEVPPSDKLGKQLRSFTDWLKTMKKIHGDQLPPPSGETDTSIQKLAEQSNKEAAVVTEAMADVLLHQGKTDKAIEVYKKLSLLNPSKSAYFAAKIDQLKEH